MGSRKRLMAEKAKEERSNIAFAKLNNSPIAPRKMQQKNKKWKKAKL